jgi:hypothetical protein
MAFSFVWVIVPKNYYPGNNDMLRNYLESSFRKVSQEGIGF